MYVGDDPHPTARTSSDEITALRLTERLTIGRRRRLARIKRAVATSEYENPLKLSVALDRLIDKLAK